MIFRDLDDSRLKREHLAIDIIQNAHSQITGFRGNLFVLEDEEALICLKDTVENKTDINTLKQQDKIIIINDGKGIK